MEHKKKIYGLLPWVLMLVILGIFTLLGIRSKKHVTPFEAHFIKADLLSTMRIHLLEAIEAEKNAVLAMTDESSEDFAARARQAADSVEDNRQKMASLIHQERIPREVELSNEFHTCWTQLRELDQTILELATQNTNLKAQRISTTQCAKEIAGFEESLHRLIASNTAEGQCNEVVTLSYTALTASLNVFVLHKPHIESADDQEMDKIEQRISAYDASVRQALQALHQLPALQEPRHLQNAEIAYEQFMIFNGEVLKLSRANTNVKSAELSLHKKRLISSQCQEILATLKEAVQARRFKATK